VAGTATEPKPKRTWYPFYLWHLFVLMTLVAIACSWFEYRSRRRALVVRTYDAQKAATGDAVATLVRELESDGFVVSNDCEGAAGSGEWRYYVALTATKEGRKRLQCFVKVMGFVSHNAADCPTWAANLPMTISRQGRQLDDRFVHILTATLRDHGWEYRLDSECTGHGFDGPRREQYVTP
jgi:hypothetical protein